jgi:hypothetical protein
MNRYQKYEIRDEAEKSDVVVPLRASHRALAKGVRGCYFNNFDIDSL